MSKAPSRVAQESREADMRARAVQRKIKELSTQVSNPQKYFGKKTDERTQSTVERFRRYFAVDLAAPRVEKRKPTRAEMRTQRNRALIWSILAIIFIFWVFGKILQTFRL